MYGSETMDLRASVIARRGASQQGRSHSTKGRARGSGPNLGRAASDSGAGIVDALLHAAATGGASATDSSYLSPYLCLAVGRKRCSYAG